MRTIFTTIAEFNKYVEGFTIDTTLQQLQPSLAVAQHSILALITPGVLTAILNSRILAPSQRERPRIHS